MKTYNIKATEAVFRNHGNLINLPDLGLKFCREQRKGGEVVTVAQTEATADLEDGLVTWLRSDGYEVTEVKEEPPIEAPKKKAERAQGASS